MGKKCFCQLRVCCFGLALGIVWGLGMFLLGLAAWLFNWGNAMVVLMSSLYLGYDATFVGSLLGGLWGFVDALIGGVIFAWLYNVMSTCCYKKCEPCEPCEKEA